MNRRKNPLRDTMIIGMTFMMATLLFFTGCSSSPKESSTTATAPEKTWNLKFWIEQQETLEGSPELKQLFAELEKKTNGRVKVTPYWGETLAPRNESINALKNGLADFGRFATMFAPGEFPVSDIVGVPFLVMNNQHVSNVLNKLYKEGYLKEYDDAGIHVGAFVSSGQQYLLFKNKPVTKMEDLKGLSLRSQTPITVDLIKSLGATPVAMGSGEVYLGLDRGVVDGALSSPTFMAISKWYEVGHVLLNQPLYSGMQFYGVNKKVWDSFPEDIKTIMTDWFKEVEAFENQMQDKRNAADMEVLKKNKVELTSLTLEELERWKKSSATVVEGFIKKMNERGLPGQKIVDIAKEVTK